MTTFSGSAAGYKIGVANGRIRVTDIDASDGDTGSRIVSGEESLDFADRSYSFKVFTDVLVNTTTVGHQSNSAIAELAGGGHVITWQSTEPGDREDVYAQAYDAAGNKIGRETLVNTSTKSDQTVPAIAALADGGYVITWMSSHVGGTYNFTDIFAQRYDALGNAVGSEQRINTTVLSDQNDPQITGLTDGGYVIAWHGSNGNNFDVYAQRFDADGNKVGGETRINAIVGDHQLRPVITALADGGYVIAWDSYSDHGDNYDIYARRFDAAGNAVGGDVRVNATVGQHVSPSVTALADGGYVLTWGKQGDNDTDIYARRYDAAGNALGGETRINATTAGHQFSPAVAAFDDGGYVVAWTSSADGGGHGVYAQRFDAAGNAVGGETLVNSITGGNQFLSDVATLGDGGYVVTWTSSDTHSDGIYARYFDENGESQAAGLSLTGTDLADVLNGGSGVQMFMGLAGNDVLNGGHGNDVLDGGNGDNTLSGDAGDDRLHSAEGKDTLHGGTGDDSLAAGSGNDALNGNAGRDFLDCGEGRDIAHGDDGADYLSGWSGTDTLFGDDGDDALYGVSDNDRLAGGDGADLLDGGSGDDTLIGGRGNDRLLGDTGNDLLNGGKGADVLNGADGRDTLIGGAGADRFVFSRNGVDSVTDFVVGEDLLALSSSRYTKLFGGALAAGKFVANADGVAHDADDHVIYETDTGKLFYDPDGNGAFSKTLFAVLGTDSHPTISAADFIVL